MAVGSVGIQVAAATGVLWRGLPQHGSTSRRSCGKDYLGVQGDQLGGSARGPRGVSLRSLSA